MFAAGDSLVFNRRLPDYLPSNGWAVRLTVSKVQDVGAPPVVSIVSAPDATNAFHQFNVNGFLQGSPNGVYILQEEVFNAGTGEKHQIYFNDNFVLLPDLADGAASANVKTTAQQMLELIVCTLKELYKAKFTETDVQRSRFVLQKTKDALEDYQYWKEVRQNEIQMERARNGRPPGNVCQPVFAIGV